MAIRHTVRKTFSFHAAHCIPYHSGHCSRPHGHTYTVTVEVEGDTQPADGRSDGGMVIDFGDVKQHYRETIHDVCDHRDLNDVFDFPTTAENLSSHFLMLLRERDDRYIAVEVSEGPKNTARAEWVA